MEKPPSEAPLWVYCGTGLSVHFRCPCIQERVVVGQYDILANPWEEYLQL